MVLLCQLAVEGDSKVIDGWLASQCGWTKTNWTWVCLGKLLPCTHPDELGLSGFSFSRLKVIHLAISTIQAEKFATTDEALSWKYSWPSSTYSNARWGWTPLQWVVYLLCRGWRREARELFLGEHRKWPWRHWTPFLLNTPVAFYPAETSESTTRPVRRRQTRIPFCGVIYRGPTCQRQRTCRANPVLTPFRDPRPTVCLAWPWALQFRLNGGRGTRTGFWEGACEILGSSSVDDLPCARWL